MPSPAIDNELAALRAGRTSEACAAIVAKHGPLVMAACRRVLRDEGLAEDAAQETFVLLVKKARLLPPETPLAGWLYQAACRTALNHQRAAIRRRARETSVDAMDMMTPESKDANLWAEIEPHLDEAMLELPERQRGLVVQCYFQNQSQRAAAAALGCSESVVSRELSAALERLRQFFLKRQVTVSGVVLMGLLSANAASASMAGGAGMVTAMMGTTSTASVLSALMQSKLTLTAAAVAGTATLATVGYTVTPWNSMWSGRSEAAMLTQGKAPAPAGARTKAIQAKAQGAERKGKWEASFQFTSAMAMEEMKKQVLLEGDPDKRYALLQKMGIGLSRKAFDELIAKGMDGSVALQSDTYAVLANRTEVFDNYLMAWSNEDPMAALNWAASQPDGPLGMRKQLLYALEAGQLHPETLREWIGSLTKKVMREEAMMALEWMENPSSIIAKMGKGANDGFLVDLAMLKGGKGLDWEAFGSQLGAGKRAIVGRAMRQALDGGLEQACMDQMIRGLAKSADPSISTGAVAVLTAARGGSGADFVAALKLAAEMDLAGMTNFKNDILRGWAVANPQAALQHTGQMKNMDPLRMVMRSLPSLPDEATLMMWMDGTTQKARDIAISALYGYSSSGAFEQLERAMRSPNVHDQVEAVQEVMRMINLEDAKAAAEWVNQLPHGKDRQDIALALSRRLAAVDPQAALDLAHNSGLQGRQYEIAISQAVLEFAARNDLPQSTLFIQQIMNPKSYADALGKLAMVKFPGHPQEAFAYLQANSRGDWQPAALRMLSEMYYNKLGNIDANAAEILKLDLARLGPDAAARAGDFMKVWVDQQVPLSVPLAWTQQMPPAVARQARLELAKRVDLKVTTVQQYYEWLQSANIGAQERKQLLNALNNRRPNPAEQ